MQSSFNVIKNNSVISQGSKEIKTNFQKNKYNPEVEDNIKNHIESYENLAATMLGNARRQSESILSKAYEEAQNMEQDAMTKAEQIQQDAYLNGYEEGKKLGYEEAYKESIEKLTADYETGIASINEMLSSAAEEYKKYLQKKEEDINNFIIKSVETILKQELKAKDGITSMVYNAISEAKNAKDFIIRCNGIYVDELRSKTPDWKEQLAFKGEIIIIKDNLIEEGSAVIDKGNGKITISIDEALQKIREILEGNE